MAMIMANSLSLICSTNCFNTKLKCLQNDGSLVHHVLVLPCPEELYLPEQFTEHSGGELWVLPAAEA